MSMLVIDSRYQEYPAVSSPMDVGIMSMPLLVCQRSMTFGPVWAEPIEMQWASIWRVLSLAKAKGSKQPETDRGSAMDPVEA
jgi:hypothetical protein